MLREEDWLDYEIGKREDLLHHLQTDLKALECQSLLLPYDHMRSLEGQIANTKDLV